MPPSAQRRTSVENVRDVLEVLEARRPARTDEEVLALFNEVTYEDWEPSHVWQLQVFADRMR
ncbi:gp65 [Burkholderia phage Bcep1]|uniref:Gp65 n=1 Tax=Burkholderia phage Bcep1 TaxID=2883943 RepID=Q6UIW7_9CAUD|nr:gp65 [Burkholderia phage Bcep1]AAQ73411.1 gp65 [Burkholderia phage Bcep1]